jgi:hypothetical protein
MQSAMQARSKLPDVGTTIFTVIGQLAAEHDALNLSQGAPNFAPDAKLIEGVAQAMRAGHNQYAPMAGIAALREALAEKVETLYDQRTGASRRRSDLLRAFVRQLWPDRPAARRNAGGDQTVVERFPCGLG